MTTIHITGGTGFLGSALINRFEKYRVIDTRYDLLTDSIMAQKEPVDYIFHCAVQTAAGGYCQAHPGEQFELNQQINNNILRYWRHNQPQAKFITFGSSCAYDDSVDKCEDNYLQGVPESGYEVYGSIKRMLLVGLRAYAKEFDMKYIYYIPSTLYGPNFEPSDKHFIYDLIRKICAAKFEQKEPVVLWGDGYQTRDLLYIDDAVNIITNEFESKENEIINLCHGKSYSIRQYADIICDCVDYDPDKIKFDTTRFVGARNKCLINTSQYKMTPVFNGIRRTINYYLGQ